ncbi:diguanylate cyclase [Thalassobacillus sp. CUG 92003]|uniref:diguanylate cyclase n=1 Tax=Thalassobacillus sp. CUG 92003 TaxID=2736641 RepID=UPI0015E6585B|nr:diguanylate cyclase [Thalassobacillus sp. CUG 92003]
MGMISDLVVNISLLISFTFVWHQLFRHNRLTFSSSLTIKTLDGLLAGILGIILMHYSLIVNDITILDLRHIPVVMVAFYGGFIPPLIAAAVITVGRFLIDVNFSSFVSLFMMLAIALGAGVIARVIKSGKWKKWTWLLIYSQAVFSLALFIVVDEFNQVLDFAFIHIISTMVGGYMIFYFVDYIRTNSERYFQYKENAELDALTGLYNVRSFDHFYNTMIVESIEAHECCAVCLLDVDHFKQINDTYGHPAGDEILQQLASLLAGLIRYEDKLSRNGGEEFSILLPDCQQEQANLIAERIRGAVETYPFTLPDGQIIRLTVSMGVSAFNGEPGGDQENLYQDADAALYQAKQNGRNSVCTPR